MSPLALLVILAAAPIQAAGPPRAEAVVATARAEIIRFEQVAPAGTRAEPTLQRDFDADRRMVEFY